MHNKESILVIESDRNLSMILRNELLYWGFYSECALDAEFGMTKINTGQFSLVLSSNNINGSDGIKFIQKVRNKYKNLPLIFLDSGKSIEHQIQCFENGASLYHPRPYHYKLLLAQIKMLLSNTSKKLKIKVFDLEIDFNKSIIQSSTQLIKLSKSESRVLYLLFKNPKEVITKKQLQKFVCENRYDSDMGSVDTLIYRLRKKTILKNQLRLIETIYGIGYQINPVVKIDYT